MNRSELVERLAVVLPEISQRDVELAVRTLLAHMTDTLGSGQRIEIRGLGSFSLHYRPPPTGPYPRRRLRCAHWARAAWPASRLSNQSTLTCPGLPIRPHSRTSDHPPNSVGTTRRV